MRFKCFKLLNNVGHRFHKQQFASCLTINKDFSGNQVKRWKVLFYGTDKFSVATLKSLNSNRLSSEEFKVVDDIDVICIEPDCAVRRYASSSDIKIYTWPFEVLPDLYDIGVVVSFGHLIPTNSILACKYGMINAHPSLLPHWRGAAPIIHTILNGDIETGVTITQVSPKKFDIGNIIMQKKYSVPPRCTSKLLSSVLSQMASQMVLETLENLPLYIKSGFPQTKEGVTYARKINPTTGVVDWEQSTAIIDRKLRAYEGFCIVYTFWKSIKVILLEHVDPEESCSANISTLAPEYVLAGYCYFHKKRRILYVKCQDGWTGIKYLKIPKRGKISAQEFYNGFISKEELNNT